ncbi:SF1B family DNA helicase RecD2 [Bacillus fonticola]|uniref:SF1B family DNA helicase RecD2 n=1 Tax=Bacillus fonticola TaxID=2728853 RepID=UPI001475C893|nr:ATP-dependent RecD-like DNA helicase [Bacillus fonticola]
MTTAEETSTYVKGRPFVTIFRNEDTFYTVCRIRLQETNLPSYAEKELAVTGHFPKLLEGELYTFIGKLIEHPRFGVQFTAEQYEKELPKTKDGLITYLSSDLFEGIGQKTAAAIVDALGENAISRILDDESVLDGISQLSTQKRKTFVAALRTHEGMERVMIGLQQLGFGAQLSMKLFQQYREQTLEIIHENPYRLVSDIEGVGFFRADELGETLGMEADHPSRIRAGVFHALEVGSLQNGHVYSEERVVMHDSMNLLSRRGKVTGEQLAKAMQELVEEGLAVCEDDRWYLPSLYYAEVGFTTHATRLLQSEEESYSESEFLLSLGALEERAKIYYAESQQEAIQTALTSPLMVLTGGPGTGKTTVIKGIVELFAELHGISLNLADYKNKEEAFPVVLCAPTGRAAKRMSEATGLPASTIHRLLKWNGEATFDHNEDHPLDGKLLIVDEFSMVDMWLANQLFQSIPAGMKVVLVGDEDQLPSVGPGQVLADLIQADVLPTVQLTDIFRQENGSSIVTLAHEMKKGKLPTDIREKKGDRSFISCRTDQVNEAIQKVIGNAVAKGYPAKDIQVLAPMYRGTAGITALNESLQSLLNPPEKGKREIKFGDIVFRRGDKVLQLVNRPEDNVYNGDMGEVVAIHFAKETEQKTDMMTVSFDGVEVTYERKELIEMTHAYCCSIHKSQGSEFPIVVLPVVRGHARMLRRKLLYTAVTRSKQFLILCGELDAFSRGVTTEEDVVRQTSLVKRLRDRSSHNEAPLAADESFDLQAIDPMIGMENVTPYDFLNDDDTTV